MNTYIWAIQSLNCNPSIDGQTNVVNKIYWSVSCINGNNLTSVYGTYPLTYSPETPFIPYKDLTEIIVIKWLQDVMGANAVIELQETLGKQIKIFANLPVTDVSLPWVKK